MNGQKRAGLFTIIDLYLSETPPSLFSWRYSHYPHCNVAPRDIGTRSMEIFLETYDGPTDRATYQP